MRTVFLRVALLLLPVLLFTGCFLGTNLHAVDKNVLWRSAQPSPSLIERVHEKHGIRSVLNLRGPDHGDEEFDSVLEKCDELGLVHASVRWSARGTSDEKSLETLWLFLMLPKPVLVHCRSGADRTGNFSSKIRHLLGESKQEAGSELCIWYGHVPIKGVGFYEMTADWKRFERPSSSYWASENCDRRGQFEKVGVELEPHEFWTEFPWETWPSNLVDERLRSLFVM